MPARHNLASAPPPLRYETSVFINCPFDRSFEHLLDAIIFSTVCCGFQPRSALESGNTSEPRMRRITRAIFSSKYSIHDLSRCRGEGEFSLARFNMPLELGIAMARRVVTEGTTEEHDWLLLVPHDHSYLRFISDLGGFDPKSHDHTIQAVVRAVTAWLITRPDAVRDTTPRAILKALPHFQRARVRLAKNWGGDAPWGNIIRAAVHAAERV